MPYINRPYESIGTRDVMPEKDPNSQVIQIPPIPENSHVRIHVDQAPAVEAKPAKEVSKRSIVSIITGSISGAIAWFTAHVYAQDKMLEYEAEYKKRSMQSILGKNGLGAAAAESGMGMTAHSGLMGNSAFGNLGPGMAGALIEDAYATNMLIEQPEKFKFAKWMYRIGGKGTFTAAVGLGTGAAVGLATYAMMHDNKPHTAPAPEGGNEKASGDKDWTDRVTVTKDDPRSVS